MAVVGDCAVGLESLGGGLRSARLPNANESFVSVSILISRVVCIISRMLLMLWLLISTSEIRERVLGIVHYTIKELPNDCLTIVGEGGRVGRRASFPDDRWNIIYFYVQVHNPQVLQRTTLAVWLELTCRLWFFRTGWWCVGEGIPFRRIAGAIDCFLDLVSLTGSIRMCIEVVFY